MSSKDTPLSRFLAITASSVSKILYQGYCTDWEAGINGFEAVFGDTSAEYNNGVESLESLKLSEDHLIVTAKELRRLETKYSDNKRMTDSDRLSNGAWKMMGVLLDLLKETNIYTSDNDIKAAILGKATEHKMKGMSQRNLDTFFKKANESLFIPTGAVHRIENYFKKSVKIIEIQTGSILRENDIVRYQDIYGRIN